MAQATFAEKTRALASPQVDKALSLYKDSVRKSGFKGLAEDLSLQDPEGSGATVRLAISSLKEIWLGATFPKSRHWWLKWLKDKSRRDETIPLMPVITAGLKKSADEGLNTPIKTAVRNLFPFLDRIMAIHSDLSAASTQVMELEHRKKVESSTISAGTAIGHIDFGDISPAEVEAKIQSINQSVKESGLHVVHMPGFHSKAANTELADSGQIRTTDELEPAQVGAKIDSVKAVAGQDCKVTQTYTPPKKETDESLAPGVIIANAEAALKVAQRKYDALVKEASKDKVTTNILNAKDSPLEDLAGEIEKLQQAIARHKPGYGAPGAAMELRAAHAPGHADGIPLPAGNMDIP